MIILKSPKPFDVRRTFKWLQDDELRTDFMLSSRPTLQRHFLYWRSILNEETKDIFLSIFCNGHHIGNCGIKNIAGNKGELWIYIGEARNRGSGLGRAAMNELIKYSNSMSITDLYLLVKYDNLSAINLYKRHGFIRTCVANARDYGFNADGQVMRMDRKP